MNTNWNNMNDGRANFMEAVEAQFGRIATITRKQLVEFERTWPIGATGPKRDIPLTWPSWLTNGESFKTMETLGVVTKLDRGTFRLPWGEYDQFIPYETELNRIRSTEESERTAIKEQRARARVEKEAAKAANAAAREEVRANKLKARVEAAAKRVANKQIRLDALEAKRKARADAKAARVAAKTPSLSDAIA